MRKKILYFGSLLLLTVVLVGGADPASANGYEYWTRYYDSTYTTVIGAHIVDCCGHHWFWGTTTAYPVYERTDCPTPPPCA